MARIVYHSALCRALISVVSDSSLLLLLSKLAKAVVICHVSYVCAARTCHVWDRIALPYNAHVIMPSIFFL